MLLNLLARAFQPPGIPLPYGKIKENLFPSMDNTDHCKQPPTLLFQSSNLKNSPLFLPLHPKELLVLLSEVAKKHLSSAGSKLPQPIPSCLWNHHYIKDTFERGLFCIPLSWWTSPQGIFTRMVTRATLMLLDLLVKVFQPPRIPLPPGKIKENIFPATDNTDRCKQLHALLLWSSSLKTLPLPFTPLKKAYGIIVTAKFNPLQQHSKASLMT